MNKFKVGDVVILDKHETVFNANIFRNKKGFNKWDHDSKMKVTYVGDYGCDVLIYENDSKHFYMFKYLKKSHRESIIKELLSDE